MDYKISIIVPVYNVESYLSRCIESILVQTYSNWELILIDDGSTDHSGDICEQYAARYEKIQVIHQNNQGVSVARNHGIEIAKGDYLAFIDPDDWISKNMLETMMKAGHGSELIVCGYTKVLINDLGIEETIDYPLWAEQSIPFTTMDVYSDVIKKTGQMWNKLARRDVIGNVRFTPGLKYGEDCLFLSQLLRNVHTAVLVPECFYYYYCGREGNVVSSKPDERSLELLDAVYSIYHELRSQNQGALGVYRVLIGVDEVLRKISYSERRQYREYIYKCGLVLRKTELKDRLKYLLDRGSNLGIKGRLKFLCAEYYPVLLLISKSK